MESDIVTMQEIFKFTQTGVDDRGRVVGQFGPTGIRPRCGERIKAHGIRPERGCVFRKLRLGGKAMIWAVTGLCFLSLMAVGLALRSLVLAGHIRRKEALKAPVERGGAARPDGRGGHAEPFARQLAFGHTAFGPQFWPTCPA